MTKIKVILWNDFVLEDVFSDYEMNHQNETLFLFKKCQSGGLLRWTIPFRDIREVSFEYDYEDNRQKISRC